MEYSHTDAELVRQPIGYWSWAAAEAVVTRIRTALAEIGTTQPQAWILDRIAQAETPPTRDGVTGVLSGYAAAGIDDLDEEIDATVARGWVMQDSRRAPRTQRRREGLPRPARHDAGGAPAGAPPGHPGRGVRAHAEGPPALHPQHGRPRLAPLTES